MSRADELNKIARRQLDSIGTASGLRYVAERADIVRQAKALIDDLELEDEIDIYAVLEVAGFLAGDKVEGQ